MGGGGMETYRVPRQVRLRLGDLAHNVLELANQRPRWEARLQLAEVADVADVVADPVLVAAQDRSSLEINPEFGMGGKTQIACGSTPGIRHRTRFRGGEDETKSALQ